MTSWGGRLGLFAAACAVLACRDIAEPDGGVLAVSRVVLPSPGLVAGDTMRDSLGNVAPLRVVAFDANGDTISPSPTTTYVLLDARAVLTGDTLVGLDTGTVRIIGTVAGLQTQVQTVPVTLRPDTIVAADSIVHRRRVDVLTNDSSYASGDLSVIVQNRDGAPVGVNAVVVTYTLTQVPTGTGSGPVVVFVGGTTAPVRDTTASGGRAARQIRLRIPATPSLPDTAIVEATASYRGQSLGTVQFTIVFLSQ